MLQRIISPTWLLVNLALLLSCTAKSTDPTAAPSAGAFPVSVFVHAEGQAPVAEAALLLGKLPLGMTDEAGNLNLTLHGNEGDSVGLNVKCPAAYASPERPLTVGLRHLGNGATAARFEVECFSLLHDVVVGVRAENGPRLPILRLKTVVGKTDDQGVAHVLVQASANELIALTLDTSGNPALLPPNPTLDFTAHDSDEMVLVSQKFTLKQAPRPHVAPRAIPRHL